jgi:phage terminase large subunit
LKIQATVVFERNLDALNSGKRFIINEGGSRSSKTYSLCQLIILHALQNDNITISVVRKTFPSLRATVYRDFVEVLHSMGLYSKQQHNKSEHIYTFDNGSMVEFFSVDDEQKIRGRKRDVCWCNEANELLFDDFTQLNMRTTDKIILDYNPSESSSWLYEVDPKESITIKSTYKDNPFLDKNIIKAIEDLKRTDEDLYQIYALGKRIISKQNIYRGWEFLEQKPERFRQFIYGLDFGYQHPTALTRIWWDEKDLFLEPVIYESYMTSADIVARFDSLGIEKNVEIMADYARPEIIYELRTKGYNVQDADKSVQSGINSVKTFKVYCQENEHARKEYENYKYKKVKDNITDDPVKLHDDFMDSVRYGVKFIRDYYFMNDGYIAF